MDIKESMPRTQSRIYWMDRVRGSAILLMLLLHATMIPVLYAGGGEPNRWLMRFNTVVSPLRMPVLMFLSGMLLSRSLRKSLTRFYSGKFRVLLWAYCVWALIFLAVAGRLSEFVKPWLWMQTIYLWYLSFLLLYYLLAPLVVKIPLWISIPVLVSANLFFVGTERGFLQKIFFYWIFFLLGDWCMRRGVGQVVEMRWVRISLAVGALAMLYVQGAALVGDTLIIRVIWNLVLAVVVVGAVISWSPLLLNKDDADWLQRIGKDSLVYYACHFPVMILVSRGVSAVAGGLPSLLVTGLSLAAALLVGALLARLQHHSMLVKSLFECPLPVQRGHSPPVR
ncbi:acyltransferase family protein [uncultured Tessaracoccus sp.]|uniref:acyltransferase family protein n=1 Tax=uncultured Tessaracoccus sp. TaxID=905023 RepID=UPI00262B8E56|nr:acyltransferase family protein [uncultured Tessaracoccus sp.]